MLTTDTYAHTQSNALSVSRQDKTRQDAKTPEILGWTYIVVIGMPNGAKIKQKNILRKNPPKCSIFIWENQFSHDFSMLDLKVF